MNFNHQFKFKFEYNPDPLLAAFEVAKKQGVTMNLIANLTDLTRGEVRSVLDSSYSDRVIEPKAIAVASVCAFLGVDLNRVLRRVR